MIFQPDKLLFEAISFYFPRGISICVIDCIVYQQKVGIPIGETWAPLIVDLFLHVYCYERDFTTKAITSDFL